MLIAVAKSFFISLYMMMAVSITVIAGQSLWAGHDYVSWTGVALVTAPFVVTIASLMLFRRVARTSKRLPGLIVLATIGVVIAAWGYSRGGSPEAPLLAIAGWAGLLLYSFWYSSFGRKPADQLRAGYALPEFELKDVEGRVVTSSSFHDAPTIWIFYRGNWCPLCMAQIKEIAGQYRQLREQGVRIALVSPQPHKKTIALAKQFDVPFDFLTDDGNQAARVLGIDHPGGLPMGMQLIGYNSETVLPTVVITAAGGTILWAHQTDNYRVRPDPAVYLSVLSESLSSPS